VLARVRVPSGGFVADGATELFRDLWWNFSHAVGCARVLCCLLQDVLCGLTPHYKVAVHTNVFATNYLCHGDLLSEVSFSSFGKLVFAFDLVRGGAVSSTFAFVRSFAFDTGELPGPPGEAPCTLGGLDRPVF